MRKELAEKGSEERRALKEHQVCVSNTRRGLTAKMIDSMPIVIGRRPVFLWILKKLIGKPMKCRRCREMTAYQHLQLCTRVDIDGLVKHGDLIEAAGYIGMASQLCLGREYPSHDGRSEET